MLTEDVIASFGEPVSETMMARLQDYMGSLDSSKTEAIASCRKYLETNNTLQGVLHVQYVLNDKEILLQAPDDANDLEKEFNALLT
jgi:hypothetical protein